MQAFEVRGMRAFLVPLLLVLLSGFVQFSAVRGTEVVSPIRADASQYVAYAYNLKHSGTYSNAETWRDPGLDAIPDKHRPPGYAAFLRLFLDDNPDQDFIDRVTRAQALLGIASTLLAYLIALQCLPRNWAFVVGVLVATSPHMAMMSTYLLSETLFTTLLLGSVLAIISAARDETKLLRYAVAGLLLGLCTLVRPQPQYLPLLAVLLGLAVQRLRAHLPGILLGTVCFAAVLAPWVVRNMSVERLGGPDLMVNTLHHGSFPNMMYRDDPRSYGAPYRFDPDVADHTRDLPAVLRHIGALFAEQPLRQAQWYLIGKPGVFLGWHSVEGAGDILIYPVKRTPYFENPVFMSSRLASALLHWPLMLLALAGMFAAFFRVKWLGNDEGRHAALIVIAGIFAYAVALHMVVAPFPRYAIPFRPLAYILALAMAHALWLRSRVGRAWRPNRVEPPRAYP